jgi:hypothetical protein
MGEPSRLGQGAAAALAATNEVALMTLCIEESSARLTRRLLAAASKN